MVWKIKNNCHGVKNLSSQIKCSFSNNSAFFCPALFNSTLISTLLKVALKNFKRILLVHCFDGFFCFLNWFFKVFLLNWLKLRAQFRVYRSRGLEPLDPSCLPVCLCLKTNQGDRYFTVHKFKKSHVQWNVLLHKENLFHTSIQRESKQLLPAKKSRRCRFFISHLSKQKKKMSHESLLF